VADHTALEAALDRDPYDADAHAVYGDWLQQQGDPRGELASLAAASEWNRQLEPPFLHFLDAHPELLPPGRPKLTWCGGFIQRAEATIEDATALLQHASSRFLAELAIENPVYTSAPADPRAEDGIEPVIDLLGLQRRRALRVLEVIGDRDRLPLGWLGDVSALSEGAPDLERLSLSGGFRIDRIHLPRLQQLAVRAMRIPPSNVEVLRCATWPCLASLELRLAWSRYDALDEVGAWFSAPLPSLQSLAITQAPAIERVLVPLMLSPAIRRLRRLDLHHCGLVDDHVTIMEARRDAFANLDRFDVSNNYLSARGVQRLRAMVKQLIAETQTISERRGG
jgi:uncharacterized protein (TIGR02996 family)